MTAASAPATRPRSPIRAAGEWLLSLALPRVCLGCGSLAREASSLCAKCRSRALADRVVPVAPEGVARLVSGPRLSGPVRKLVHGLKYEGHRAAAVDLVDLLLADSSIATPAGAVLVPVPLTGARLRERGYNQAGLLAREISRRTGIPVAEGFLERRRFQGSQTRRTGEERREALGGMFGPGPRFRREAVPILVDDVLTTGATLSACAAACLYGGVPEVHAACAACAGEA